ncbi:MAG: DUF4129 domain-containing protein [Caldilineaceae bacterium]
MNAWPHFFSYWLIQIMLLANLFGSALAQPQPTTLSLDEYKNRLTQAAAQLEQTGNSTATVASVQKELAIIKTVLLPSGQMVTLQPLLGATDEKPPDREVALARLRLVRDQLKAAGQDHTAARLAMLDQILAQPEFNTPLSLWERFLRWLRSFLPQSALGNGQATGTAVRVIAWGVAGVGAILLIVLLSYWLQGLFGSFVVDFDLRRRKQTGEEIPLTATTARQQATVLAQAGNYREAVRQLYLSALLSLEEHALIRYDRSLTNREVLAQVQKQRPVQSHLQPIVETFDNVWYGIHEPDQATFVDYAQEIDELAEMVQQSPADKRKG